MRTRTIWALLSLFLLALAAPVALADRDEDNDHQGNRVVVINNYGVSPFIYGGYSYIPLKSATDFLGAALLWDSLKHQATVTYNGRKLGLVVGSPTAYYGGRAVALPVAPVMVGGQMLVPVNAFDHYLGVPVRWDEREDRVMMRGQPGWGYYQVMPQPPVEAVYGIEHGGPPPWAPAHGWRRKHQAAYYAPAPFVYSGVTYVPLRDAASIAGAALLWNSLEGRAILTYNGREIGLAIGSPTAYYGGQTVMLSAAPIVVRDVVYVPADFCDHYLGLPYQRSGGVFKLKGPHGWHDYHVASAPPGRISFGKGKRSHYQKPRERSQGGEGWLRVEQPRGQGKAKGHAKRESQGQDRRLWATDSGQGKGKHKDQGGGKWESKGQGNKWKEGGQGSGGGKGRGKGRSKHKGGEGD